MRRAVKLTGGLLSVGLLLAGCGDAPERNSSTPSSEHGDSIALDDNYDPDAHFNWAYVVFASSWDPIKSVSGSDINFYEPVYDRLLFEEIDGSISPMLATEFTSLQDGEILELTLQEGLTFSDGTPFNAEAVKFNLDRTRGADSTISGELSQIESVAVVDEHTVHLHVADGIGPLPVALANRAGVIVSPTAAQAGLLDSQPVGIGPYVTTEIVPGTKAEYEKSPGYWDPDAQRVATMTYYYMPDDQTRLNALRSGELHGARINPDEIATMADSGLTPLVRPSSLYLYIAINTAQGPFDDPQIRKAINMAIDREAISQGLYDGYCTPQIQPFAEGTVAYSDEVGDGLDVFAYDPEAAKEILADAGVDQLSITAVAPNITIYTKFAEVVQSQLADIGIDIDIHIVPPSQMVQEYALDKTAEALTTVHTGINDPDSVYSRYLAADALYNPGGTHYPELEQHAAAGAATIDPDERQAAYAEFMNEWIQNPPHQVAVCMVHLATAFADNVSGVAQPTNGQPALRGVAITTE